jgi:hypothetical protein
MGTRPTGPSCARLGRWGRLPLREQGQNPHSFDFPLDFARGFGETGQAPCPPHTIKVKIPTLAQSARKGLCIRWTVEGGYPT